MAAAAPERTWRAGSCHCGAVRFRALLAPLNGPHASPVLTCNCSICKRNGYLLVYPAREDVEWISGHEGMAEYRTFGKLRAHRFCSTCGCSVLLDMHGHHPAGDVLGINVRMLQGVDLDALTLDVVNGREMQPEYNDRFE